MSNGCCPPPIPGCGCPPTPSPCSNFNIPGPPGQGDYAQVIANFAIPANTATPVTITLSNTSWIVPGQYLLVGDQTDGRGTFIVQNVTSPTTLSALWVDAAGDSASGTTFVVANSPLATGTGAPGFPGANGVNAFTLLTANAIVPPDFVTPVTLFVGNSQWAVVGQYIVVGDATDGVFTLRITAIPSPTQITGLYQNARGDLASGQTVFIANGAQVSPAGAPSTLGPRSAQEVASGSSQNSGTGVTNLLSYVIPAGGMANNGDYLDIEAVFELTANGNTKTIAINFGGTAIVNISGAQNVNPSYLVCTARVTRLTSATQYSYSMVFLTDGGTIPPVTTLETAPGETLTNAITIQCTGQSSAATGDVKQRSLRVRYVPI